MTKDDRDRESRRDEESLPPAEQDDSAVHEIEKGEKPDAERKKG